MPQSYYNTSESPQSAGTGLQSSAACPNPLTPPAEQHDRYEPVRSHVDRSMRIHGAPSPGNTAADMAQSQEDSIYLSPAASPTAHEQVLGIDDGDKMEVIHDECKDGTKTPMIVSTFESRDGAEQNPSSPTTPRMLTSPLHIQPTEDHLQRLECTTTNHARDLASNFTSMLMTPSSTEDDTTENSIKAHSQGFAPVDLLFDRATATKPWSFSNRRLYAEYPSHVFQSFSRYSGTQQSDRQTYNVDVTVLTVDISQCTMTGYLLIKGLTPEHDTLQTYFTGEIIGGPSRLGSEKQCHTFRTSNPAWGATEKTDLMHWARFPAWRSLSSHAKRDINFDYPTDGGNWWEQENIFMRWKEHFLVPDHRTKSIAGASFEGFYYICLNQVQGRISGIYYHSKSERYQQLELKHEGQPEIFNRGVTPCVEFR